MFWLWTNVRNPRCYAFTCKRKRMNNFLNFNVHFFVVVVRCYCSVEIKSYSEKILHTLHLLWHLARNIMIVSDCVARILRRGVHIYQGDAQIKKGDYDAYKHRKLVPSKGVLRHPSTRWLCHRLWKLLMWRRRNAHFSNYASVHS